MQHPVELKSNGWNLMQVADLFIKEKKINNGESTEELWVVLRKANGTIVRKLRFIDYEKNAVHSYPLRNQMLLYFYNYYQNKDITKDEEAADTMAPKRIMAQRARKKQMNKIKITGIDLSRTYKPDDNDIYHHFYFYLSGKPPERWIRIFTREGEKLMKNINDFRYIWLEDNHIAIRCIMGELRTAFLSDIKEIMNATNSSYQKHLNQIMSDIRETEIDNNSMKVIVKHMFKAKPASS